MNLKTESLTRPAVVLINRKINKRESFITLRLKSFGYALQGILYFFRSETNARIHLASTFLVIILSIYLQVSIIEAIAIIFSIAFVWVAEMLNTAIERTMDMITKEKRATIKTIKDVSAGAVLVASMAAVLVGSLIFIPKILSI